MKRLSLSLRISSSCSLCSRVRTWKTRALAREGADGVLFEDCGVVGFAPLLAPASELFGVALDDRAFLVEDGLDLCHLLVAQLEAFGEPRQHVLEELQDAAAVSTGESAVVSAVRAVAASGTVPWPALGHGRSGNRDEHCRRDGQDDVSCLHVYLRCFAASAAFFRSFSETSATSSLLTFLRKEMHGVSKERSRFLSR